MALLYRVTAYVKEGLDAVSSLQQIPMQPLHFPVMIMMDEMITRSLKHGAGDFKAISKSAEYLFRCGHVQHIDYCCTQNSVYIRANCLPEVQKDRSYKIILGLEEDNFDIVYDSVCGW